MIMHHHAPLCTLSDVHQLKIKGLHADVSQHRSMEARGDEHDMKQRPEMVDFISLI